MRKKDVSVSSFDKKRKILGISILAGVLILLAVLFLFNEDTLVGQAADRGGRCIPPGPGATPDNACDTEEDYCPSLETPSGTRARVCTDLINRYARCNGNEPSGISQCVSSSNDPAGCFATLRELGTNPRNLEAGQFYCLPSNLNSGQECDYETQCRIGFCALNVDGTNVCYPLRISSGSSCTYDRQCLSYDLQTNPDACAGEDRTTTPFTLGTCRLGQSSPSVTLSVRSDLRGNYDGLAAVGGISGSIPSASTIDIFNGQKIQLGWSVNADTRNSGLLSCAFTSSPPISEWNALSFTNLYTPLDKAPIPARSGIMQLRLLQTTSFSVACTNAIPARNNLPVSRHVLVGVESNPQPDCRTNPNACLLAHYDFEGGTEGGIVRNKVGNFNHLRIFGNPLRSAGTERISYKLDGEEDYFRADLNLLNDLSNGDLDFGRGDFTISLWVNPNQNRAEVQNENIFTWGSFMTLRYFKLNSWGSKNVGFTLNDFVYAQPYHVDGNLIPGWNHIVITRHANFVQMYFNGNLVFTTYPYSDQFLSNMRSARFIQFGNRLGGTNFLDGSFDEIKIFSMMLSREQVEALYSSDRTTKIRNPPAASCLRKIWNADLCNGNGQIGSGALGSDLVTSTSASCPTNPNAAVGCYATCKPGYNFVDGKCQRSTNCGSPNDCGISASTICAGTVYRGVSAGQGCGGQCNIVGTSTAGNCGFVSNLADITSDNDGDNVPNIIDNCPNIANFNQGNRDDDFRGDSCTRYGDSDNNNCISSQELIDILNDVAGNNPGSPSDTALLALLNQVNANGGVCS